MPTGSAPRPGKRPRARPVRRRGMQERQEGAMRRFASFREFYPFYSLAGDWVMFVDILRGRVRL